MIQLKKFLNMQMVLTERTIFVEQFGVFSPVFPFYSRKFH